MYRDKDLDALGVPRQSHEVHDIPEELTAPALIPGSATARALYQLLTGQVLVWVTEVESAAEPALVPTICTHLHTRSSLDVLLLLGTAEQGRALQIAMPWSRCIGTRGVVAQIRSDSLNCAGPHSGDCNIVLDGPANKYLQGRSLISRSQILWVSDRRLPVHLAYLFGESAAWSRDLPLDIPLDIILAGAPYEGDSDDH